MAEIPPRDDQGYFWSNDDEQAKRNKALEDFRKGQEAALNRELVKRGISTQPQPTDPNSIVLEWAMPKNIASLKLEYLVDPFLPCKCVVGFFGRGSTAKSSFLATLAARISEDWTTLWISVEELTDWITQRHLHAGGELGTLAAFSYTATKRDAQGRATGSTFDVYRDLESSIKKAQYEASQFHNPPRPLRLVVLDTAVGLTTWGKGESPNDDGSVKRLLGYLQALAEQYDICIAIIGHSNKGKHDYFADTVAGSSAWTNSPRLSFVHARDRRQEHSFVMRVAKSNLSSAFGVMYSTVPVLTLHQHEDGHASVMCKADILPVVWGDADSMEMFDDATRKPDEEDAGEGSNHKRQTLVQQVINYIVQAVYSTGQPVTREMVHERLGRPISRREWTKVDEALSLGQFQYKVGIETGNKNRLQYTKLN